MVRIPIYGILRQNYLSNAEPYEAIEVSSTFASTDDTELFNSFIANNLINWYARPKSNGQPWKIEFTVEGDYRLATYSKSKTLTINVIPEASTGGEIANYTFEGNGNDSSGNSNELQESNVTYSSGATGLAANFNGLNSSFERGYFAGMSSGHNTSFKVYFNDVQSGQMVFQNLVSNVDRTTCSILDGTLRCGFYDGSYHSRSGTVQVGRWYDVEINWDGSDFELLIDDVAQTGTLTFSANIITPKFVIGVRNDGLLPFDGSIDEFSITVP